MTDVAGNGVFVKLFAAHLAEHGVDGEDQISLGVDERTVEIEDHRADGGEIAGVHKPTIVIPPRSPTGHPFRGETLQKINLVPFSDSHEFA
jgi:hypothetical protein